MVVKIIIVVLLVIVFATAYMVCRTAYMVCSMQEEHSEIIRHVESVVKQHNNAMEVLDSNFAFLYKKINEYDNEIESLKAEIKALKECGNDN